MMGTMLMLVLSVLLMGWASVVSAWELSLQGGVGVTQNIRSDVNGIWYQNQFPHQWDTADVAWKVGGLLAHEGSTLQVNYVDLGAFGVASRAVADHQYDFHRDRCLELCRTPDDYSVRNDLQGVEVLLGHRWSWGPLSLGLHGGGAVLFHRLTVDVTRHHGHQFRKDFDGTVGALVGAGEACYRFLCGTVSYYHKLSENHNPLMGSGVVVPMLLVRVPLAWLAVFEGSGRDYLWQR